MRRSGPKQHDEAESNSHPCNLARPGDPRNAVNVRGIASKVPRVRLEWFLDN